MNNLADPFTPHRFDCGCVFGYQGYKWLEECAEHKGTRPENCTCLTVGQEDGTNTCWQHHDCSDGSCTHNE